MLALESGARSAGGAGAAERPRAGGVGPVPQGEVRRGHHRL